MRILNGILNGLVKAISTCGIWIIGTLALGSSTAQTIRSADINVFHTIFWIVVITLMWFTAMNLFSRDVIDIEVFWGWLRRKSKEIDRGKV